MHLPLTILRNWTCLRVIHVAGTHRGAARLPRASTACVSAYLNSTNEQPGVPLFYALSWKLVLWSAGDSSYHLCICREARRSFSSAAGNAVAPNVR